MSTSESLDVPAPPRPPRSARDRPVLVSGVRSDAHTWNLVFLQLLIEELGHEVVNLGPCVPEELLISEALQLRPALVVISSVNGHGYQDGLHLIRRLRADDRLANVPAVIGGKLGITGGESESHLADLLSAGFDAVFDDGAEGVLSFRRFVGSITAGATP
ncbi:cobalamin B12-binding domain-containing protein [Amycolatopsis sp. NPDC058986]|uniref:cobalamin B12-binding domain-containing protein n=1 Tax=unclassified Amycolatopsis TaxID=2618356 RepID=UPI00366AE542